MKRELFPAVRAAIQAVSILVRKNPDTGLWAWRRTGKPWHGGFATAALARADAERWLTEPHVFEGGEA